MPRTRLSSQDGDTRAFWVFFNSHRDLRPSAAARPEDAAASGRDPDGFSAQNALASSPPPVARPTSLDPLQ